MRTMKNWRNFHLIDFMSEFYDLMCRLTLNDTLKKFKFHTRKVECILTYFFKLQIGFSRTFCVHFKSLQVTKEMN